MRGVPELPPQPLRGQDPARPPAPLACIWPPCLTSPRAALPPTARDLCDNVSHKCAAQPSSAAFCDFPSVFAGRLAWPAQHSWSSPPLPASPDPSPALPGPRVLLLCPRAFARAVCSSFTWLTLACPLGLSRPPGQGTPTGLSTVCCSVLLSSLPTPPPPLGTTHGWVGRQGCVHLA